jgi:hypothetical protein
MVNGMWEWFQQLTISDTRRESTEARIQSRETQGDLHLLEQKVASLSLVTQAMWELMQERGFSQLELERKVEEIDLRDGKKDGRLSAGSRCPDCGRRLNKKHANCFWCGARIPGAGMFPTAD